VLDDYPHLNPIRVVLGQVSETMYSVPQCRIFISLLSGHVTNAREARILYHEFVHAVTDALARLQRDDPAVPGEPRMLQITQAKAMDEGLADFFACSLAVRNGAPDASFYPPPLIVTEDGTRKLAWNVVPQAGSNETHHVRVLGGARAEGYPAEPFDALRGATIPKPSGDDSELAHQLEKLIYEWAELWGRFLWSLRVELGADVAETLIAHSIFFLTRWSSFDVGVLAIAVADRMLFGGAHRDKIMELGQGVCDFLTEAAINELPARPASPRRRPARENSRRRRSTSSLPAAGD
jgi:hypothetical protein